MKRAVIFTVCILAIGVSGQPNKSRNAPQDRSQDQSQPTIFNLENCNSPGTQPANPNDDTPDWNTAIKRAVKTPDGWLVIVAAITGLAILYQAREMARATKEMRRSIALQEVALRQWVDLLNWRVDFVPANGPIPPELRIRVDVVNPTQFPLTLPDAYIVFGKGNRYLFRVYFYLTPKNPYTVDTVYPLTSEMIEHFRHGNGIRIEVEGNMAHIGALGKLQPQPFCGVLKCREGHPAIYESETPVVPSTT